jgi:hypothetical protein
LGFTGLQTAQECRIGDLPQGWQHVGLPLAPRPASTRSGKHGAGNPIVTCAEGGGQQGTAAVAKSERKVRRKRGRFAIRASPEKGKEQGRQALLDGEDGWAQKPTSEAPVSLAGAAPWRSRGPAP